VSKTFVAETSKSSELEREIQLRERALLLLTQELSMRVRMHRYLL